jgi:phosphoribosyl 1,2-cyclic phosphodiesterase
VAVETPSGEPIVLDLGTGLRFFGETQPIDGSFRGHALVTHLHWDHVQGLPFFVPANRPGARFDVYGPVEDGLGVEAAFGEFMRPPYFPVGVADLAGDIAFHDLEEGEHTIAGATVVARRVPHIGPTFGYRLTLDGRSVVYIPDHQQPLDGSMDVADAVLELCDGADLLIHDAQYTAEEFAVKAHWGHCTVEYALTVAAEAGVSRLALFHHDPDHDDAHLDRLLDEARAHPAGRRIGEVMAAHEGLTVALSPAAAPALR